MSSPDLAELRSRIDRVDAQLVALAAERIALVRQVAESKHADGLPTVDYAREAAVLARARDAAAAHGLPPSVAEELLTGLIRASLSAQDEDRLRYAAPGAGRRAVIVGGAGRMGRWFARFLATQGFEPLALDPRAPDDERTRAEGALSAADLVLCATPPAATAALYESWLDAPPRGVIADVASIKTPLIAPVRALRARGARVASLHPMFGPGIVLLRDADVVVCDTGDAAAGDEVESLFRLTTARIVHVPLEEHDAMMADLLSLAHATAIAFALALPEGGHPVRSTTFGRLEALAAAVVRESPEVYYEIQARNPYSAAAVERLGAALERIVAASRAAAPDEFAALFADAERRVPSP